MAKSPRGRPSKAQKKMNALLETKPLSAGTARTGAAKVSPVQDLTDVSALVSVEDMLGNTEGLKAQEDALAAQSITPKKLKTSIAESKSRLDSQGRTRAQRRNAQKKQERKTRQKAKRMEKLLSRYSDAKAARLSTVSATDE